MLTRCQWAGSDPLMVDYHDREWGLPVHDDRLLFEFLTLEGMQAGLSWMTILRKRENFRRAFAAFDPQAVASFGPPEIEALLADPLRNQRAGHIGQRALYTQHPTFERAQAAIR